MVVYCAVPQCKRNSLQDKNCSFFTIPKSSQRRSIWLAFLGKTESDTISPGTRICQDHFERSCFVKKYQRPVVYQKCSTDDEKVAELSEELSLKDVKEIPGYIPVGKYEGEMRTRLLFNAVPTLNNGIEVTEISSKPETCIIDSCSEPSENIFSFPNDKSLKTRWCNKLEISTIPKGAGVCSLHFAKDDFEDLDRLKHDAVPLLDNPELKLPSSLNEIEIIDSNSFQDDEEDPLEGQDPLDVPEPKRQKVSQDKPLPTIVKKVIGELPDTALKLEDLCRLCLKPSNKFQQISEKIGNMISVCTSIQMIDPKYIYPSYICVNCWQNLMISYEFWQNCNRVNGYVRQIINSNQILKNVYIDAKQLLVYDQKITDKSKPQPPPPSQGLKRPNPEPKKFQYKCKTCNKIFTDFAQYKQHTSIHETEPLVNPDFKCTLCDKFFASSEEYQKHIASHELVEIKTTTDADLTKNGSGSESEDVQLRLFKCDYCSRQYFSIIELKAHLRIHFDERQIFECKTCSKQFSSIAILKYHEVLSHAIKI